MKSFGRLFSRSRKPSSSKSQKAAPTRKLRSETLEKRQLLAGDFLSHHNYLVPQDVTRDFEITPMDALTVINALNRYGTGSVDRIPVTEKSAFVDVSGDNDLSPIDALQVINALGRGEGINELIELRLDVREHQRNLIDPSKFVNNPPVDESLLPEGSREYTASVGDIFDLEVSYNDLRTGNDQLGAFTIFADLFTPDEARTFSDFVEPIVTESQGLAFFDADVDDADAGEIIFSLEEAGFSLEETGSPTFTVSIDDFQDDPSERIREALRSFGFTETNEDGTELDQFQVSGTPLFGGEPGATFERRIRFLGDALANQQIPNLNVDVSGLTTFERQVLDIEAGLDEADGGEFVFSLDTPENPSFPVSTSDFQDDPVAQISAALRSFGFTETAADGTTQVDQFEIIHTPQSGGSASFEIRFVAETLANQGVSNLNLDASSVTSSSNPDFALAFSLIEIPAIPDYDLRSEVLEVPAINVDGSVNTDAIRFNIITNSRTTPSNTPYYNSFNNGNFSADGYDDVGGTAFVINPQGIPGDLEPFPFLQPFDTFSLPVRMTQSVEDFVIQLGPPPDSAITLFTHPDDEDPQNNVPADLIKIATTDDASTDEDDRFGLVVIDAQESTLIANEGNMTVNKNLQPPGDNNTIDLLTLVEHDAGDDEPIAITWVSNGFVGDVTLEGSNATYVPDQDVIGPDSFTYIATKGTKSVIGTVSVTINQFNHPPEAVDDAINATQNTVRIIQATELTGNDNAGPADEDQDLTITAASPIFGTQGTVDVVDGNVSYEPPGGFVGTDRFQYTVEDSGGLTATAVVTVTVAEVLAANPDTLTTDENTPLTFTTNQLLANDTGNGSFDALTEDLDPTTEGSITANGDGSFTYTPPADVFGDALATFTYTISDDEGAEATGAVTIDVTFVNDPPIAVDDDFSVDELTTTELDVLANDSPGPNEEPPVDSITIIDIDTTGTAGDATIINNGQNIAFTPSALASYTTSLTYTIEDSEGLTATATVMIDVVPVTRPRASNDTETVDEDSGLLNLDVLENDLANEGQQVTLEGIGALLQGSATVSINDNGTTTKTDDTIDVIPADNFFGTIRFTYSISDTGGVVDDDAAATGTVTVNVTPVNDEPQFVPDEGVIPDADRVTPEDTDLTISGSLLLINDLPGPADVDPPFDESDQTLRITAVSETSEEGGTVTLGANNEITYSPAENFNGTDVITYTISDDGTDGLGEDEKTTQGTLTITVTPVNDAPVPGSPSFNATEDEVEIWTQTEILAGSTPGPDTATDELASQTLSVTGRVGETSEAGGSVTVAASGAVTYTPPEHFFGEDSFVLTIQDDGTPAESANLTVVVNVAPVNDPPVAGNDSVTAFQNVVATFSPGQLLANDRPGPADVPAPFDESDQTLTITAVRSLAGTQGKVSLNDDGSIRFEPTADFEGETSFEYTISDNDPENPLTDTAIVTVNVQKFQPSSISGSVFFDEIASLTNPVRNGMQDASEAGLSGVTVTLSSDANANVTGEVISKSVFTELDGSFDFNSLPPGTFTVNFALPKNVTDGPDFAGSQGDADSVENQFTIDIAQPGGIDADNYRFTVLGLSGSASETGNILAIDHLADNPDANDDSDGGRRGGTAAFNADGQMTFFKGRDGLEGARFVEVAINEDRDEALLSYIDKETNTVRHARLKESQFLLVPDGEGGAILRIFGGLDDFDFADSAGDLLAQEFGDYRDAIDQIMAEQS